MQITAVLDYLSSSLAALQVHHRSLNLGFPLSVEVRDRPLSERRRQLQLWWVNTHARDANESLWDYCELDGPEAINRRRLPRHLKSRGLPYNPDAPAARVSMPSVPGPTFRFHPMRFRAHHPSAQLLAQYAEGKKTVFTKAGRQVATQAMVAALRSRNGPFRDRVELPDRRAMAHEMIELPLMYGEFHHRGQTIFNLAGELARFRHTDIGKVLVGEMSLPATAFYVHFGPQRGLSLRPGWCVDGAYVARMNPRSRLQFLITCAPPSAEAYHRSTDTVEPVYLQTWGPNECSVPAATAIDHLVSRRMAEWKDLLTSAPLRSASGKARDVGGQRAEELEWLPHRRAVWSKALKLLIGSLLYLSGYADDSEPISMAKALGYWIPPATYDSVTATARARAQRFRLNLTTISRPGERSRRELPPPSIGPQRRRTPRSKK
jgi:hypothetical protein